MTKAAVEKRRSCPKRVLQVSHKSGVVFFILLHYQAFYVGLFSQHIHSTYPHCNTWIRDFLHCEIGPRNPTALLSSEPLFILWSREGNLDNRAGVWFSPNHFVPLYTTRENKQKCHPEPDQEDSIQGNTGNLKSGKTSCKENTTKESSKPSERSGTSIAMSKKGGRLEDFGFKRGISLALV